MLVQLLCVYQNIHWWKHLIIISSAGKKTMTYIQRGVYICSKVPFKVLILESVKTYLGCAVTWLQWFYSVLTLIMLEPKVISFANCIEPGQPSHPCSLTKLYTVGWPTSHIVSLISLKVIMDSSKKRRWIIPFKKFSRLSVN